MFKAQSSTKTLRLFDRFLAIIIKQVLVAVGEKVIYWRCLETLVSVCNLGIWTT